MLKFITIASVALLTACTNAPASQDNLYTLTIIDANGEAFAVDYNQTLSDCVTHGEQMAGRPAYACDKQAQAL